MVDGLDVGGFDLRCFGFVGANLSSFVDLLWFGLTCLCFSVLILSSLF